MHIPVARRKTPAIATIAKFIVSAVGSAKDGKRVRTRLRSDVSTLTRFASLV